MTTPIFDRGKILKSQTYDFQVVESIGDVYSVTRASYDAMRATPTPLEPISDNIEATYWLANE